MIYKIDLNNYNKDSIWCKDFEIREFKIDDDDEDSFLFLGKDNNNKTILTKYDKGSWNKIREFDFTGKEIHSYKNFIAVLGFKIDERLLLGLGGTRYDLQVSYDMGKTWESKKLPLDSYVKPNSFYKDEVFISYSGGGKITKVLFGTRDNDSPRFESE